MDPDHRQLIGVLLLQFPQLRKNMHAVDSTIGPEIENDDLALQSLERHWTVCIQPIQALRKFGRGQFTGKRAAAHGASRVFNRPETPQVGYRPEFRAKKVCSRPIYGPVAGSNASVA